MKTSLRQFIALAGSIALLAAPVAPLVAAPSDLAPFDPATVLPGSALQADEELLAYDMSRIISTQTRLIRYEATEYQRKVAEQRARAFMAAHRKEVAAAASREKAAKSTPKTSTAKKTPKSKPSEPEVTTSPGKKKGKTEVADNRKTESPTKPEKEAPAEKPSKPVEKPKELPRYIAVDTVKDKRASAKAKKVVMIWDTHAEKLVGNNLYDVENPPKVGQTKVFETYAAEYIGAGL